MKVSLTIIASTILISSILVFSLSDEVFAPHTSITLTPVPADGPDAYTISVTAAGLPGIISIFSPAATNPPIIAFDFFCPLVFPFPPGGSVDIPTFPITITVTDCDFSAVDIVVNAPPPDVTEVDVDIKVGSDPNCVNTKSKGSIPVAILGSVDFDVADIFLPTLEIDNDDDASTPGVAPIKFSIKDKNGDGFDDLNFKFNTVALGGAGLLVDDNELFVTGNLFDAAGPSFVGSDIINLAGGPNCFD